MLVLSVRDTFVFYVADKLVWEISVREEAELSVGDK